MKELTRSNDPVFLSWLMSRLDDLGMEAVIFDTHTSIMEGSIGAIPRRIMVADDDHLQALKLLEEAEAIENAHA